MSALEKTLRWIVIIGVFALPFVCLFVATSLFFPYITGKNFAFRIIVEVITGAWLALAIVNSEYRPRRSWVLLALAVFVGIIFVADLQGVNPFKSLWSNFERMDGWVTLIHLLAYTVVAASVINTEKMWTRLFQMSLGVSVFLSMYGFLQVAGVSALGEGGASGLSARIDATFGNPIYLAAYMLFHVFIAALLWAQMWVERGRGKRLAWSLAYGFIIVLDTLALFFTGTRGTILGLVGGALLAAIMTVLFARNSRNVWRFAVGTVVAILVVIGGFWAIRDAAWIQNIGFLQRMATISTTDTTIKARFLNMGIAWQGVKERPILGWGQENYAIVFDKYYDPRMYADEPWFDRVHDIVFDWLIAGGFLGLISYLSIFAAALWALWGDWFKGPHHKGAFSLAERSILTGLLAGYTIHNLTVFDNITSYILFGTILAYIVWRASSAMHAHVFPAGMKVSRAQLPYVAIVAALCVWGVAWGVNERALAANRLLLAAVSPPTASVIGNLQDFESAIALGTYGTQEAREQLSQIASSVAQASGVDAGTKQQFFDAATSQMKLQEAASPLDARFPLFLGVIYNAFGDYADGATALEKAHELSPRKQSIYFEMAQNAQLRGDSAGALSDLKTAYELETDYTDARLYYAAEAIETGNDTIADQLLAPVTASGQAADPRILAAYVARKEYAKAVPLWLAHIAAQPSDMQGYFTLAAIYYQQGDHANAIKILQSAEAVDPGVAAQADPVIQQIKNGTVQISQ